jgi:hypothetical protein
MFSSVLRTATILIASSTVGFSSFGGVLNAIPTCYTDKIPAASLNADHEIFLVIDQTTLFDSTLKQLIADNIRPALIPGGSFTVVRFSAFTQGYYTDVLVTGQLEKAIPKSKRDDISKVALASFDRCMSQQPAKAAELVGGAMRSAFSGSSSEIAKSDILASLKDISGKVKQSSAKKKIVIIASDMIENSGVTNFYSKKTVREIRPDVEIKLVESNHLFSDFGGAAIYVVGAGLLPEDVNAPKGTYRSPQVMRSLLEFWSQYFSKSNAKLIEFGAPAILNQVKFE